MKRWQSNPRRSRPTLESRPIFESLENRLLLAAGPDLAISLLDATFAKTPIVPGDKGVVAVELSNIGGGVASGSIEITVRASTDTSYDLSDPLLGLWKGSGSLNPGDSTGDILINVTVPTTATPGNHYVIVKAVPTMAVPDTNAANDVAASPITGELAWVFGTVGDRKNIILKVNDASGPVTFSLSGPGSGVVTAGGGGLSFGNVTVTGSTAGSSLSITTTKGAYTTIDSINVLDDLGGDTGSIKGILAKNVNLESGVVVDGLLGSLALHDISSLTHYISLNAAAKTVPSKAAASITVHALTGCTIDAGGIPIKSFTAADLSSTDITAPWIGSLTVNSKVPGEGNFSGSLTLTGGHPKSLAVDKLSVAGALDNTTIAGPGAIGSITARQWTSGSLNTGYLKSLTVKGDMGASVTVTEVKSAKIAGNLSSAWTSSWLTDLNVGGNVSGAAINLTYSGPSDGRLNVKTLTVKGWITSSTITIGGDMTVGFITAGGMENSMLLAGATVTELPDATSDFDTAHPSTIQKILVKGMKDAGGSLDSFINSSIAAWTLGDVAINDMKETDTGTEFGITCHSLAKYLLKNDGQVDTSGDWVGSDNPLDPPLDAQHVGDYWVRIVSAA